MPLLTGGKPLPIVLLPGMDGTGDLFEPLLATAPAEVEPIVLRLPPGSAYDELLAAIRGQLPAGTFAVLGESFSGPLAVAIARETADRVVAVILCNSFITPPLNPLLRFAPWPLLFLLPPPRWVIRTFFVGHNAPDALVSAIRAAIAKTPRRLLAARLRAVFQLPKFHPPIQPPMLFLQGSNDMLVRPDTSALRHVAPRFTQKEISGPHLLLQASPEEAWRAIVEFLRQDL